MTAGRLIFPALRWQGHGAPDVWPTVRAALDQGVGGFVVFGGDLPRMREIARRARAHSGRPILLAADLERGAGQQFEDATPLPPPAALSELGEAAVAEAARITAREALAAGIGWVLAPVADLDVEPENPIVGTRSFGAGPHAVARRVRVWVEAAQSEGVIACVKHFPGHGRTTADSHEGLPVVDADATELEADLLPFRAAIEAGAGSVMLAHVCYPALQAGDRPASLAPSTLRRLRVDLGFQGLVATDALIMGAIAASGRTEAAAAVEAVAAGVDVLLYPHDVGATLAAIDGALESGELDPACVEESLARIERAAAGVSWKADAEVPEPARDRALELARSSLRALRGTPRAGEPVMSLAIVDDDRFAAPETPRHVGAPGTTRSDRSVLVEALRAHGCDVEALEITAAEAPADPVSFGTIALFSDVRAWKGRAGPAAETLDVVRGLLRRSPRATLLLFTHPRVAGDLPEAETVLCAWSGEPLMQEAAAMRLTSTAG